MKRTLCIFLFAVLVLGLAGCAGSADSWDNGAAIDGSFSAADLAQFSYESVTEVSRYAPVLFRNEVEDLTLPVADELESSGLYASC